MKKYILGIDQSTQGTKALLLDENGKMLCRADTPHRQLVNDRGWVEHDPEEILCNTVQTVKKLVEKAGICKEDIAGVGLSNQRETGVIWDRETGKPLCNAIVWQCGRARDICEEIAADGHEGEIKEHTGLNLSPYFTAGKIAWALRNVPGARELSGTGRLGCGTVDTWLLNRLTLEKSYKTDYSNASRTQMFNIHTLRWDEKICGFFGINTADLAKICDSDSLFGTTDFQGYLSRPVPIRCVLGDSHGALYGQGCHKKGMVKATYGTGSSVMMNIGPVPVLSRDIVTSVAWGLSGRVDYVLEGNLNYTGATITWLKDDVGLISASRESGLLASKANPGDSTYIVPAFSGLGAPSWDAAAKACIVGITRSTGRNELVKAAEESIAYQIADIVNVMERDSGLAITQLKVDGGPTRDRYLMQFQSDILNKEVTVPDGEELSGIGVACCAGIALGLYDKKKVFSQMGSSHYLPQMDEKTRVRKYSGWKDAVAKSLSS